MKHERFYLTGYLLMSWLFVLPELVVAQCSLTGCVNGACYISGSDMKCSLCLAGYYKSSTQEICNPCNSRCKTCTYFDTCQSCKDGYYLDTSQNFCGSCPTNCATCTSSSVCKTCDNGSALNAQSLCASSSSDQSSTSASSSKSSIVGQVIGYCVSGVVLVLCCVITLLHQKRKQEEEEKARQLYKEEQARLHGVVGSNVNHDNIEVLEDPEFNNLHNRPPIVEQINKNTSSSAGKNPIFQKAQEHTNSTTRLVVNDGGKKVVGPFGTISVPTSRSPRNGAVSLAGTPSHAATSNQENSFQGVKLIKREKMSTEFGKEAFKDMQAQEQNAMKDNISSRLNRDIMSSSAVSNQSNNVAVVGPPGTASARVKKST